MISGKYQTMTIRKATKEDITELKQLFLDTVNSVNIKDYSHEQITDWASCGLDLNRWYNRFEKYEHFVCCNDKEIVGFCAMDDTGFINSMFVSKNYQRQKIGQSLIEHLITLAHKKQMQKLTAEVSITAKPFFEHFGFKAMKQQNAKANKMTLINFVMMKDINFVSM